MRYVHLIGISIVCFAISFVAIASGADQKPESSAKDSTNLLAQPGRLFDMKVPQGFKSETVDEPGILKWTKDAGEIYLVVGDLFGDSGEALFKALRKAADKDKKLQEVRTLRLKGGRGFLCKEKAPEDPSRLQAWRIVVVTNKKVINVDFTAPAKDFSSFVPAFETAINSFKLKSSS